MTTVKKNVIDGVYDEELERKPGKKSIYTKEVSPQLEGKDSDADSSSEEEK